MGHQGIFTVKLSINQLLVSIFLLHFLHKIGRQLIINNLQRTTKGENKLQNISVYYTDHMDLARYQGGCLLKGNEHSILKWNLVFKRAKILIG